MEGGQVLREEDPFMGDFIREVVKNGEPSS